MTDSANWHTLNNLMNKELPWVKNLCKMTTEPAGCYDYPVEVKDAGDKGRGVFATRNIKKGEMCCWYGGIVCSTASLNVACLVNGCHGYLQSLGEDANLAGFVQPFRNGGVAQICNDASTTYKNPNNPLYKKRINVKEVTHGHNDEYTCMFVATKNIKKGQELLYSYGPEYWETHYKRTEKDETFEDLARGVESTTFSEEDLVAVFAGNDFTLKGYVKRIGIVKAMVCEQSMHSQASKHA